MQNAKCKSSERLRVDYIASRRTTKQIFAKPIIPVSSMMK